MKKYIIIALTFFATASFAQTKYELNYDSVGVGKRNTTQGVRLNGRIWMPSITTGLSTDSVLVLRNGRVFKQTALSDNYIKNQGEINQIASFNINSGKFDDGSGVTTINGGTVFVGSQLSVPLTLASDSSDKAASTKWTKQLAAGYISNSNIANETTSAISIAYWGDSMTQGVGASENQDYPTLLQRMSGYRKFNAGVGGETSTQIKNRMVFSTEYHNWPSIIWAGHNNFRDPNAVESDVEEMVLQLGHNRFFVLSILNGDYEYSWNTGVDYPTIIGINNHFASTYGDNYIDVRSYLVSQYNPSIPQDVIDHGHDVIPSSLRSDNLHLNDLGYKKVAEYINQRISKLNGTDSLVATKNIISLFSNPPGIGMVNKNEGNFTWLTADNDVYFNRNLKVGNGIRANSTTGAGSYLALSNNNVDVAYFSTDKTLDPSGNAGDLSIVVPTGKITFKTNNVDRGGFTSSGTFNVISDATANRFVSDIFAGKTGGDVILTTNTGGTSSGLYFYTAGSERLKIQGDGNSLFSGSIEVNGNIKSSGNLRVGLANSNNLFFDNSGSGYMTFSALNNGNSQGMNFNAAEFYFNGKISLPSGLIEYPSFASGNLNINNGNSGTAIALQSSGTNKLEVSAAGVKINNLSGSGDRPLFASSDGTLKIGTDFSSQDTTVVPATTNYNLTFLRKRTRYISTLTGTIWTLPDVTALSVLGTYELTLIARDFDIRINQLASQKIDGNDGTSYVSSTLGTTGYMTLGKGSVVVLQLVENNRFRIISKSGNVQIF